MCGYIITPNIECYQRSRLASRIKLRICIFVTLTLEIEPYPIKL